MRNILSLILVILLSLSAVSCSPEKNDGVTEQRPQKNISTSLGSDPEIALSVGDSYNLAFRLSGLSGAEKASFSLMIEDPFVIEARFTGKTESYIYYTLTAVAAGECNIYLENPALSLKSEVLLFSVSEKSPDYIVGALGDADNIIIEGYTKKFSFAVLGCDADTDGLRLVIDDEKVVKCTDTEVSGGYVYYKLKGLAIGNTTLRVETTDGKVKSDTLTVFVIERIAGSVDMETSGYFISKNSGIFHKYTCSMLGTVNPENMVHYDCTREEMIDGGFTPCQRCDP